MKSKTVFRIKGILCLCLGLLLPFAAVTGAHAQCASTLVAGTDFSSADGAAIGSYSISDVAYIEHDSFGGLSLNPDFDFRQGSYNSWTAQPNPADRYAIVSNPHVLDANFPTYSDNVPRLVMQRYDSDNGNQFLLWNYTLRGVQAGSDVRITFNIEDLDPDCSTIGRQFVVMVSGQDQPYFLSDNTYYGATQDYLIFNNSNSTTVDLTFTNVQLSVFTISLYSRFLDNCKAVAFSDINVYTCLDKTITVEGGSNYACEGSSVTLVANNFDNLSGNYTWEKSTDGGNTYTQFASTTTNTATTTLDLGSNYIRVTRGGESETVEMLGVVCCSTTSVQDVLFVDDFGTTTARTRSAIVDACFVNANVSYTYVATGKVEDNNYCVVSNLDQADPGSCGWPGNKTDHTGNANGAFLVVNAGTLQTLFYERSLGRTFCQDTWYTMSLYAANVAQLPNEPAEFRFEIVDEADNVLNSWYTGPIDGMSEEGVPLKWKRYGFSFMPPQNTDIRLRIYSTSDATQGNDFAIDDITVTACSPDVTLYADYPNGNIDYAGDCGNPIQLNAVSQSNIHTFFGSPYYLWQVSYDGTSWETFAQGTDIATAELATRDTEAKVSVIVAETQAVAQTVAEGGTPADCSGYVVSNAATISCMACANAPRISIDPDPVELCSNSLSPVTLTAEISVTSGMPAYSYEWSVYDETSGSWTALLSGNGSTAASLSYTIDNPSYGTSSYRLWAGETSCSNSETVDVSIKRQATASDLQTSDIQVCTGNPAVLSASSSSQSGNPVYTWYTDESLTQQIGQGASVTVEMPAQATTYYVTLQSDEMCENQAGDAAQMTVTPIAPVTSALLSLTSESQGISGSQVDIRLGDKVGYGLQVEPYNANYTESWFVNGNQIADISAHFPSSPFVESTYTVVVTDECGNSLSSTASVGVSWPTLITPHTSGSNDDFVVGIEGGIMLTVYDRSGNVIYNGNDGWPQSESVKKMPGIYYYVATTPDGSVKKGTVEIYK